MTRETYTPSLNSIRRGPDTEVQESTLVEAMDHSKEDFGRAYRTAVPHVLIDACLQGMSGLPSQLGTIGTAFTLPDAALRRSIATSTRTVSLALALPMEAMGSFVSSFAGFVPDYRSNTLQPNTAVGTYVEETPWVEHRGWKDYIDPAEYEARLNAVTPRSANNEAEDYVRPTPRGRIRTIRRG